MQQNWPEVLEAISQLSPDQQRLPVWRYWQARALAEVGQAKSAMDIYRELATQDGYYAQLAAMQARLPKIKNVQSLPINTDRLQAIANMPAMQRAYELYQLNDKVNASSEWHWALNKLPQDQYLDAAQLATQWGWFDCAILTNQLLGDAGDVTLRYPLAYRAFILTAAKQFNLNPAWLFAEIRQESLFQVQARSSAGALGLMQLLPDTALLLADKMHWQFTGDATLFDAGSNIEIGGDYLQKLTHLFHGDIVSATAAYNAGPARVDKWLAKQGNLPADIRVETLPWYETRNYVKNIMASTTLYEELLGVPDTFNQRMGMVVVKKGA
jgi:soluble lytic murein transglycosylase